MSGGEATRAPSPQVGDVLLAGAVLVAVELDVARGSARLVCEEATLVIEGVRSTTLLGPWDGSRGTLEHAKVVAVAAGEICLEVRVQYVTVPRVYRVVGRAVRCLAAPAPAQGGRDGQWKLDASERM